jgi:glucosamine--fructose-6-phosphate aminotransferase (isomerizing)
MKSLMEKEIFEQGEIIANLARKHIVNYCVMVNFPSKIERVKFIASGSSYNCACLAARFFKDMADIEAECEFSSEFLSRAQRMPFKANENTLYFFISQSGETTDTVEVLDIVKATGGKTFALVNNSNSTLYNGADFALDAGAGEEKSIAATKSFTACVFCTWLCALKAMQNKSKDISGLLKNLEGISEGIEQTFALSPQIEKAAAFMSSSKSLPIVGYGYYLELAKEAALKIKETSFIDANAYPLGEFVHGHVALLNQKSALLEIYTDGANAFELKNLKRIADDYNPKIIAITDFGGKIAAEHTIIFKKQNCAITKTLCIAIILQLLALKTAYKLKRDVDNPHGLSKVVK